MLVNSKWAKWPIIIIYLIIFAVIIYDVFMYVRFNSGVSIIPISMIPMQLSMVALLFFYLIKSLGASVVRYADDGAIMEFYIEHPLLKYTSGDLIKRYDFPKEKLISYKIKRKQFRKEIELKLTRGERGFKKAKIPATFLLKEERKAITDSLDKILEKNKDARR